MYTYVYSNLIFSSTFSSTFLKVIPKTTLKNFVKWLETGQKSRQTMPGWDQNVEEIQGLKQYCVKLLTFKLFASTSSNFSSRFPYDKIFAPFLISHIRDKHRKLSLKMKLNWKKNFLEVEKFFLPRMLIFSIFNTHRFYL